MSELLVMPGDYFTMGTSGPAAFVDKCNRLAEDAKKGAPDQEAPHFFAVVRRAYSASSAVS
jgi:hypothetical protein